MHFPVYLPLGPLRIHPHWIFESLAYFIGFRVYLRLRRKLGDAVPDDARWWVITAAALGAAIGSLMLSVLEAPTYLAAHWRHPYLLLQGKTIVGGLIGGWIAVEWCKKKLGLRQRTGDLFVLPLCVGMAIGRIGCLLTGPSDHTFGSASTLPWAFDFGDGIRRHPLPAYEILFLVVLAAALSRVLGRLHVPGDVFKMFMVSYMSWRFAVEFLKDREPLFLGVTAIQWACLAVLVYYVPDLWRWSRLPSLGAQPAQSPETHG